MNDFIHDIAQIDVPKDFLAKELRTGFSDSLARLMVVSLLQAQRLEQQQRQIRAQHDAIQQHAESLESHATTLGTQQQGNHKLAAMADEVKRTRDRLIDSVAVLVDDVHERHDTLEHLVEKATTLGESLAARLEHTRTEAEAQLESQKKACIQLNDRLTQVLRWMDEAGVRLGHLESEKNRIKERLSAETSRLAGQVHALRIQSGFALASGIVALLAAAYCLSL